MEFLQPFALFALAGAAVPALLHLLQRRRPPTVVFPAVRYLVEAEERHSRRLRLRNLLLLILRTALIVVLALAAARPVVPTALGEAHAPSAVAVIVDNSLSSGAVVGGRRRLDALREAARAVGARAAAGDRLWLIGADGTPRRLRPAEWGEAVTALEPDARRLDLGAAVRTADAAVRSQELPGAVVVLSDLQASAISDVVGVTAPVLALEAIAPPANRGIGPTRLDPATWSPGGAVVAEVVGNDAGPGEVALDTGRAPPLARGLAGPGASVVLPVERIEPGWHRAWVRVPPDELRADDEVQVILRAAPPAAATSAGAGAFVDAALSVLTASGRVRAGRDVVLGERPGPGSTIVFPPEDPARVGAANQALAARGVTVRFGALRDGEWSLESALFPVAPGTVRRRYVLAGGGDALATAGGEPWIVRVGSTLIVASRFEEDWTDLPLLPAFVPFVDALVNRGGAGEAWMVATAPGDVVRLPTSSREVLGPGGAIPVSAAASFEAPLETGAYFVTGNARDTIGAVLVNPDPRESDLRPAAAADLRRAFGRALRLTDDPAALARTAFAGRRAELTAVLLAVALLVALVELALASTGGVTRGSTP